MNKLMHKNLPSKHNGFSLIEALVAFMIISVGMLGIASLQTLSMKAGHTAVTRSSAIFNVEDIMERMRINPTQIASYVVAVNGFGSDRGCSDTVGDPTASTVVTTVANTCTSLQIAEDDIYRWKRTLARNVTASIAVVAPIAPRVLNRVTVSIIWTERAVADTAIATANNYTVTVEM